MTKEISRRSFLGGMAALALFPSAVKGFENDYVILEHLNTREVNSLKKCLAVPKKIIQSNHLELTIDRSPEIVYHIRKGEPSETDVTIGLAYMLNKDGFFITANHIFSEDIERKYKPSESPVIMAHSPDFCFTYSARFLMSSKKDDLLLGKIDFPVPADMKPVGIADERVSYPTHIHSLGYKDLTCFNDVLEKIVLSGKFIRHPNKEKVMFSHKKCIKYGPKYKGEVTIGTAYKASHVNPRCSNQLYFKGKPGDSGSPVLDLHGRFMGIITDGLSDVMCYTGPLKVRKMIEYYIKRANKQ